MYLLVNSDVLCCRDVFPCCCISAIHKSPNKKEAHTPHHYFIESQSLLTTTIATAALTIIE